MNSPNEYRNRTAAPARTDITASGRRGYAIFTGLTVLCIFIQSITAGKFIEEGVPRDARETWTNIHGAMAYPIMGFALIAAIIAIASLRAARPIAILATILFLATVGQWASGHAIATFGMNWVTPFHVTLAFVVYGLAIWLSIRSAMLNRTAARVGHGS